MRKKKEKKRGLKRGWMDLRNGHCPAKVAKSNSKVRSLTNLTIVVTIKTKTTNKQTNNNKTNNKATTEVTFRPFLVCRGGSKQT